MGRVVRRVPLDFEWPIRQVWSGFVTPERFTENECPDCKNGYSPRAQYLFDLWYGYAHFVPADNGSTPLTPTTPAVRAFAERNVARAPEYYGTGELAIVCEASRLAKLWNGQWSHHLNDQDVAALVEAKRLHDFTHTWVKGSGWQKIDPPVIPTAEQVNEWSLRGLGHDSINAGVVISARCAREGVPDRCVTCHGHSTLEAYEGQRAEADAWMPTPPPEGEGWQLWETTTEGSPVSPVFDSAEQLAVWMADQEPGPLGDAPTLDEARAFIADGWAPSMVETGGEVLDGVVAVARMAQQDGAQ